MYTDFMMAAKEFFNVTVLIFILLTFHGNGVHGYPYQAPASACDDMTPGHGNGLQANSGAPYLVTIVGGVTTYSPGQTVQVKLSGSVDFKGFLLQARKVSTSAKVGTFSTVPSGSLKVNCDATSDSVSHAGNGVKNDLTFEWTPPSALGTGDIQFVATFVKEKPGNYYVKIPSVTLQEVPPTTTAAVTNGNMVTNGITMTTQQQMVTDQQNVDATSGNDVMTTDKNNNGDNNTGGSLSYHCSQLMAIFSVIVVTFIFM